MSDRDVIRELDVVALTHDIEAYGLRRGDVGAVVHCHRGDETFEVEFVTAEGETVALLTLTSRDIRPLAGREILHVRDFAPAAS